MISTRANSLCRCPLNAFVLLAFFALVLVTFPAQAKLGKDWVEAVHSNPVVSGGCSGVVYHGRMLVVG
jgi:hypothetical protein